MTETSSPSRNRRRHSSARRPAGRTGGCRLPHAAVDQHGDRTRHAQPLSANAHAAWRAPRPLLARRSRRRRFDRRRGRSRLRRDTSTKPRISPCSVHGSPYVEFLDSAGHVLGEYSAHAAATDPVVVLIPRSWAAVGLTPVGADHCGGPNNHERAGTTVAAITFGLFAGETRCRPSRSRLRIRSERMPGIDRHR